MTFYEAADFMEASIIASDKTSDRMKNNAIIRLFIDSLSDRQIDEIALKCVDYGLGSVDRIKVSDFLYKS